MPSATTSPAADSGAHRRDRTRGLTHLRSLGPAALLSALALVLAPPAAASTGSGVPSPQPAPSTTASGGPSPQPAPQATAAGVSRSSQDTTSQGSASQSSASPSVSTPAQAPYTVPATPEPSLTAGSAPPSQTPAAAGRWAHAHGPRTHPPARRSAARRERALAEQQFRHRLALESRSAPAVGTITSAPAHRDGTLLLIGAGVLLSLAAAGGALLRRLWRLHGQWYGGRPA